MSQILNKILPDLPLLTILFLETVCVSHDVKPSTSPRKQHDEAIHTLRRLKKTAFTLLVGAHQTTNYEVVLVPLESVDARNDHVL